MELLQTMTINGYDVKLLHSISPYVGIYRTVTPGRPMYFTVATGMYITLGGRCDAVTEIISRENALAAIPADLNAQRAGGRRYENKICNRSKSEIQQGNER